MRATERLCFLTSAAAVLILLQFIPSSECLVLLDRRLITSSLTFPRQGGTRQGIAGCPVRRVLHPRTGELHCPLSSVPCPPGQWLVLVRSKDGDSGAECRVNHCVANNTVLWKDGECHAPDEPGLCGEGMRLYVDRYGEAYCDCKPNHYMWPLHGVCYAAYTKGPCESGSHLKLLGSGKGVPACQINSCMWEHLVQGPDKKCHELGNPALCPAGRVFNISPESGQPDCVSSQFLAELSRDLHGCFAGSRMSILHSCQH